MTDIMQFMSSPAGIFLIVLNSILATVIAVTGFFVLRSSGKTLQENSQANLLVIQQASKLADTANEALRELSKNMATTIDATQTAVTTHNHESTQLHQKELDIQQQMADTLARQTNALNTQSETIQRQTELMSSQVSIMQDMSDSDTKASESIEKLHDMVNQLLTKFENFSPEEIMNALDTIHGILENLVSSIKRKDEAYVEQKADAVDTGTDPVVGTADERDSGSG